MKKRLALILALVLMLLAAACGAEKEVKSDGSEGSTGADTQISVPSQTKDPGAEKRDGGQEACANIEFEKPFVILDNELATVEMTQFYQEDVGMDDERRSCIVMRVRNNSEREFL